MKLLLDQNISFRVAKHFKNSDLQIIHINEVFLNNTPDLEIWEFAKTENFAIVTFDADFYDLQLLKGFPPKIIWLRIGNSSTLNIQSKLINNKEAILEFLDSDILVKSLLSDSA
jgi:predicted nuclease of predicted toxin-antitoxin system